MSSAKFPRGAAENSGFMPTALHIAEWLMVEQFEHRWGSARGLEGDFALLRVDAEINVKAPLAERNLASRRDDDLGSGNIDGDAVPLTVSFASLVCTGGKPET